jgi:L,D-peptidoglycan transpeptidase YkuD (ErfK/YbiS/YcfS/YnhG family)
MADGVKPVYGEVIKVESRSRRFVFTQRFSPGRVNRIPMANICRSAAFVTIRRRPGNPRQGLLAIGGRVYPCALGRGGIAAIKREGDGATPMASMRALALVWREDRGRRPVSMLPASTISTVDGWCDDPADPNYNRPVRLPFRASHERMQRDDRLYDRVVILDWNFTRRMRGAGSAIFLHVAKPGLQPTEGCIAVEPRVMRAILPMISPRTVVRVLG